MAPTSTRVVRPGRGSVGAALTAAPRQLRTRIMYQIMRGMSRLAPALGSSISGLSVVLLIMILDFTMLAPMNLAVALENPFDLFAPAYAQRALLWEFHAHRHRNDVRRRRS
mgnify:CR=1 FL=1